MGVVITTRAFLGFTLGPLIFGNFQIYHEAQKELHWKVLVTLVFIPCLPTRLVVAPCFVTSASFQSAEDQVRCRKAVRAQIFQEYSESPICLSKGIICLNYVGIPNLI